jgi:hypothetical protein
VRATFFRDGFEPQTMDIAFDEERAVQVTLPALPSPDAAPAVAHDQPTVQAPVESAPSRRKKEKKATEKVDEDIYRRPGMGEKP